MDVRRVSNIFNVTNPNLTVSTAGQSSGDVPTDPPTFSTTNAPTITIAVTSATTAAAANNTAFTAATNATLAPPVATLAPVADSAAVTTKPNGMGSGSEALGISVNSNLLCLFISFGYTDQFHF
ncbi:hypothetical protein HELRODRAFT_180816 [Helobdella robusta]|uniref:Uncharacterized protein n=1 Tax=Helobdella robusta TaxID=6412 RepID=T1FGB5_HELRO|nr:hypothetical protein HELRODRAFT_180816 [Helobdella robusta]ESN93499.1 hypothetical protein HELRODRAFT_180816 [Helobdella robusta]